MNAVSGSEAPALVSLVDKIFLEGKIVGEHINVLEDVFGRNEIKKQLKAIAKTNACAHDGVLGIARAVKACFIPNCGIVRNSAEAAEVIEELTTPPDIVVAFCPVHVGRLKTIKVLGMLIR